MKRVVEKGAVCLKSSDLRDPLRMVGYPFRVLVSILRDAPCGRSSG